MAHVVVGGAEAVGGEQLLEVLAQGGGFTGQVAAGDGGGGSDQLLMKREAAARIAIKGLVEQVAQQGHHPLEHRPIAHRRVAAVDAALNTAAMRCRRHFRQPDRRQAVPPEAEAIGLQPVQIATDRPRSAVALPMQPHEESRSPLRQIARRQGRDDRLQLLAADWIGGGELRVTAEQANQEKQPLQIEQARVAMQLPVGLAGPGAADAPLQCRQLSDQQRLQVVVMAGHHRAERRKALRPAGPHMGIGQGGRHLLDHGLGHLTLAPAVPRQAGGQGGVEPPADPLHRRRQQQGLGDAQAPGAAGLGGIDDRRNAGRHRLDQPLLQPLLDVDPGPLHGRIAKHLGADRIGGEHQGRRFTGGGEQGRQGSGQGGLTAGWRADQQMAAQWRRGGGGQAGSAVGCLKSFARELYRSGRGLLTLGAYG